MTSHLRSERRPAPIHRLAFRNGYWKGFLRSTSIDLLMRIA
jgi:hypothetical protein